MQKKAEKRHPYLQWVQRAFDDQKRLATKAGEIITGPFTSAIASMMSLAYNLYLIHHNLPSNLKTERLCQKIVKRLKDPDHFWGALYETYAFALFAVAGFHMELEDESDGSSTHCEFSARSKSGRTYSIECKARNRQVTPVNPDGTPRIDDAALGISKKLKEALSKSAQHERVVFIDIDMPNITEVAQFHAAANETLKILRELEGNLEIGDQLAPPAYVFVTNIPDHRGIFDSSFGLQAFATGFKIRDFGHGAIHHGMHARQQAKEKHADILSLQHAARVRNTIPSTFDGSNPAFSFSADQIPRLTIGNWYMVPDAEGAETEAMLCDGLVMEKEELAYCTYRTRDGVTFLATSELTEDEMRAYRMHPNTFFGIVQDNQTRKTETVEEMFDFLFESYQNTPREKLLNHLAGTPDFEELSKLSQRDLAIAYCERMALTICTQQGVTTD